jgi:hypothetical protein
MRNADFVRLSGTSRNDCFALPGSDDKSVEDHGFRSSSMNTLPARKTVRPKVNPATGAPDVGTNIRRWMLVLLALAVATATWGVFEFVVWNNLPRELVGKWVVEGGEQDGATFDFFRKGTMVGRINVRGQEGIINARVRVEGQLLYSTTTNPNTRLEVTRSQKILTLSENALVLQDDQGQLLRMIRADQQ